MNVADLKLKSPDALGVDNVAYLYALKPPEYAVYRTEGVEGNAPHVKVHFADDPAKSNEQRKMLAQLAPLRGEIAGLLDGWRTAPDRASYFFGLVTVSNGPKLRKRAELYDRGVGDALIVAMEGDLTGAGEVLQEVKDDISDDRVGHARFEYLLAAVAVVVLVVFLAALDGLVVDTLAAGNFGCSAASNPLCLPEATKLWRGATAGACGSFFSIALAIRGRTILPELNRTSNLMDAGLRVTIGTISGVVIVAMLLEKLITISLGGNSTGSLSALYIGLAGFLAGFAERLVPDLLAKAEARTDGSPVLRRAGPEPAKPQPGDAAAADPKAGPANPPPAAADAQPAQAHEDGCVAEIVLSDEEITPDEALPPASGGVSNTAERAAS